MSNIDLIIENLKNNIADELVNKVQASYSNQPYSTLIITDAEKIAGVEIARCQKETSISMDQLMQALNTCHNNLNNFFINLAIYETDYQMKTLEDDKSHFFVRESLLSNIPNYNEKLHKKVLKAKVLSKDYVPSPDNGIYIVRKDTDYLDLSTGLGKCIQMLDLRRLRSCRNLTGIKFANHLMYTHLEEIPIRLNKVKIDYY